VNSEFLLVVILGKVLLYTIQQFAPLESIKIEYLHKLISCDFCLGSWLFFFLSWMFDLQIEGLPNIQILSPFLLGVGISFVVHLISLGWKAKFETIIIE